MTRRGSKRNGPCHAEDIQSRRHRRSLTVRADPLWARLCPAIPRDRPVAPLRPLRSRSAPPTRTGGFRTALGSSASGTPAPSRASPPSRVAMRRRRSGRSTARRDGGGRRHARPVATDRRRDLHAVPLLGGRPCRTTPWWPWRCSTPSARNTPRVLRDIYGATSCATRPTWPRSASTKFGADLISVRLDGTHPEKGNRSPGRGGGTA